MKFTQLSYDEKFSQRKFFVRTFFESFYTQFSQDSVIYRIVLFCFSDIPSKHVIVTDLDKALAEAGQTSQVTNVIENSSDRELNDDSSLDTISIPEINILTATPVMEKRNNTKEMAEEKEEAKEDVTAAVAVSDNSRTNISNKVKLDLNGNGSFQKLSSRPKSMINVSQNDKYKTGTADDMAIEKEDLFNRQGPTRHSLHSTSRSFKSTGKSYC